MGNGKRNNLIRSEIEIRLGIGDLVLSSHRCKDHAGHINIIWVNAGILKSQRKGAWCRLSCWARSYLACHCDCIHLGGRPTKAQIVFSVLIFEGKRSCRRIKGFHYCCSSWKRIGVCYCAAGRVSNEGRNCVCNWITRDCVSLIYHGWGSDAGRTRLPMKSHLASFYAPKFLTGCPQITHQNLSILSKTLILVPSSLK